MTVSLACALLLLFGGLKIVFWVTQRLVTRQRVFNATREQAGKESLAQARNREVLWTDPTKISGGVRMNDPCYQRTLNGIRFRPYNNRLHIFERNVRCP